MEFYLIVAYILLFLFAVLFMFHLLVMASVIPYDIVWAGRIKNRMQMIKMELVSIVILVFVAMIICIKLNIIETNINHTVVSIATWGVVGLFMLNTLGNLTAKSKFEKYFFGSLTLLMTILSFIIAVG